MEILQRGSHPGWQHLNCQQGEAGGSCDEAWSALSLRQEWMDFSAAQQPLDTKKLVAFMRSVKSGQDLSGLGYKSDRSKTFCETLKKFANEHLAKLAAGKFKSPEALLGSVCGGAPDGNTMKALFETFFAGIKLLNAAKKCCGILQPTAFQSCLRRARQARPFPVPAGMNTLYSLNTKLER